MAISKSAYLFAQELFLHPYQPQIHTEILGNIGAIFAQLEYLHGGFYFSIFDLPYFNKYHTDFNPIKCITALATNNWNGSLWNVY